MEAVAKLRDYPMSARKMRLVVDLIREKDIDEALNILRFSKKAASEPVEKLLISAISNWEYKTDMMEPPDDYDIYIKEAFCNEAGMLKRFRPAAQGRAHRVRKRSSHVTLKLENRIPLPSEEEEEYEEEFEMEEVIEEGEFEEFDEGEFEEFDEEGIEEISEEEDKE